MFQSAFFKQASSRLVLPAAAAAAAGVTACIFSARAGSYGDDKDKNVVALCHHDEESGKKEQHGSVLSMLGDIQHKVSLNDIQLSLSRFQ